MARLAIEDSIWFDPRFEALRTRIGKRMAIGVLIDFWRLAQEYWKKNCSYIPEAAFKLADLPNDLFDCEFAVKTESGIYAKGSKKHFQWYFDKVESARAGGKKSAELRKAKYGSAQPPNGKQTWTENRSRIEAESNTIERSSSSSSSSSSLKKNKEILYREPTASGSDNSLFIRSYVTAFQKRYGNEARPDLRPKVLGQIKNMLKHIPVQRASDLIQVYFQMDDKWFETKCHDFSTFLENVQKISIALDTGKNNTDIDIGKILERRSVRNGSNGF